MIYEHILNYQLVRLQYRIRSDNDTDNSYSTLTSQISVNLPNQTPFSDTQTNWSTPSSTCNDTSTTTTTSSTTTTTTVPENNYYNFYHYYYSCTYNYNKHNDYDYSTTTTTTLPPPPPTTTTTLAPVIVKIGGEEVEYTQEELDDGRRSIVILKDKITKINTVVI